MTAALGQGSGNTIDIGIFDSRGHEFLHAAGFRGWSGASKREFFIAQDSATPGYIRGPLFPGEWNVILGVDRVEPEGVRYEVEVRVATAGSGEPVTADLQPRGDAGIQKPGRAAGHRAGGRWVQGDLHCHTVHSDGLNSVEDLARNAIDIGLDFLAVTDHNTNTHHEDIDRLARLPITLIPGEEVTTYWGHANMWGLREWIDFRCADDQSIEAVRRYVLQKGGLISVNHPKCIGPPWLFRGWDGYPSMEVWQAPWRFYNWESLERWDALLRRGQRVVAVGGSDTHSIPPAEPRHPHGLGNPTTWVYVTDGGSEESVLDGIRKGHVFISDAPNAARLILEADADGDGRFATMMGDTVESSGDGPLRFRVQVHGGMDRRLWVLCDGVPIHIERLETVDYTHEFSVEPSGRSHVRAELRGPRGRPERGEVVWAMTNPIWFG